MIKPTHALTHTLLHPRYASYCWYFPSWTTCADYEQDPIWGSDADLLVGAAIGQDGSVALAGTANNDFQVIKLDSVGTVVWRFEVRLYRYIIFTTSRQ